MQDVLCYNIAISHNTETNSVSSCWPIEAEAEHIADVFQSLFLN